jgi:DNA-binding MarR family transcriptional regulator
VPEDQELCAQAERFAGLFRAIYLTFHRRDGPRNELSGASRAVLQHLAMSGPLTVGEAAVHLVRAQSVVSEIVDGLARQGPARTRAGPGRPAAHAGLAHPGRAVGRCTGTAR